MKETQIREGPTERIREKYWGKRQEMKKIVIGNDQTMHGLRLMVLNLQMATNDHLLITLKKNTWF